jgi:hypothetical protein
MPIQFNEAMYEHVVEWIAQNPNDVRLPEGVKQALLGFATLTDKEKEQLQGALLAIPELPDEVGQFIPNRLGQLPPELLDKIASHVSRKDVKEFSRSCRQAYALFPAPNTLGMFLQCIAHRSLKSPGSSIKSFESPI